ncbi:sperm-associated microtubule inner protein 4 [Carettochelys insculpta]|uniref:sperm-associated microtubule inner protein 4 n=1 Tax=Carettochelys insculpta TaxID=44489 RepID=UPI003EB72090
MELLHGLPYYYREREGADILSKTIESNEALTPLQIPSRPTVFQDRYEELRDSLQWCRLPWGSEREYGGIAPVSLPEDHRPKNEPPCLFAKGHQHYGYGGDCWPRGLPIEQYYDVTQLKKSDVRLNDDLLPKPPDHSLKQLCLPFPVSHPYQTHISRYAMFPNFKSPEDQDTGIQASSHQPFHPNVPTKAYDMIVLRKTKGNPYRHELINIPYDSQKEALHWPGQHGYFHFPKFVEGSRQIYYPKPPKTVAPNSMCNPLEANLSPRTANMLQNVEKAQWITTYRHDFTGRGPMNPLVLDDYDMKLIGRVTGELGEDVELKETFLPTLSQVRPLEGRIARVLQGRQPHKSILQVQDSSDFPVPQVLYTVHAVMPSYSEMVLDNRKTATNPDQQCKHTANEAKKREEVSLQTLHLPQAWYQRGEIQDNRSPVNKFQKITDTWQTEALYRRQLAVRPESEHPPTPPWNSLHYEDLKPSRLDQYIVWHNPVSLSKPGLPVGQTGGEGGIFQLEHCDQEEIQCTLTMEGYPPTVALPEWIPNSGVPRPQTSLLELQDSFSKTGAHQRFHNSIKGEAKDLRDNIHEGRRHTFYGFNSFYFYN